MNSDLTYAKQFNLRTGIDLSAGNNVLISAGEQSLSTAQALQVKRSGFLSSSTTTTRNSNASTTAVGSTFEGQSVSITAGQDLSVKGANVLADQNVNLAAGGNVKIEAAQNTQSSSNFSQTTKSGLMSTGGIGFTVGSRMQSVDQGQTQTTAAGSTVGSTGGNVTINAGKTYTQTGSDVLTPQGDIAITAQKVDINEARETGSQSSEQKFKQSGVTVAVTSPVISALQMADKQLQAAKNTSSDRMQALAAANAAINLKQGGDAIKAGQGNANGQVPTGNKNPDGSPEMKDGNAADKAGGIGISLSLGASSSQSKQQSSADTAKGSNLNAGGNVSITATGAGADSDITVRGSNIEAGKATRLKADDQVNIVAAQNTTTESSSSKNSSGSIGVGFQLGAGGAQAGVTVSAAAGKGQGAGNSTTYTNSQVAGNTVNIESGGDTTIKGGVVKADQVTANVGGNLNIESLQGKSQYNEKSQQVGGSVTFGPAAGGSVNVGQTKINSDYLSVGEQSAIRAGDGGFNVNVQGKTNLTGGQITSTQAAIDNNKNSYEAKEGTTTTDLQNSAKYSANSVSVGVGAGAPAPGQSMSATMSGVGLGNDKGSANSTTTAGISGVAGNSNARTGDKSTSIAPIFDKDKTQKEVAAQVAITSEFGKQASKAVGDYAQKQYDKALAEKDQAGIDAWKEGGSSRVTLHAVVGGLIGGAAGVVGSGAASAAAPALDDLQGQLQQGLQKAGVGDDASKLIASLASGATAAGIGAVASGGSVAGGATAFNADMNNRQIGAQERNLAKNLIDKAKAAGLTKADGTAYTQADIENAMRNSGKGSESITQGMLVDPKGITDQGAVFTAGNDGKTLVQVNKDGSNLNPNTIDPKLAAYIVQETGGANTPYKDLLNQLELTKSGPAVDPNAAVKMHLSPGWNTGASSAGISSGMPNSSLGNNVGQQPDSETDSTVRLREIFPAHTAPLNRQPIGGSTEAQIEWANQINPLREIGVSRGVYLGGKGIDAAVTYGVGKAADVIVVPVVEKNKAEK